jgi:hypothetical protein
MYVSLWTLKASGLALMLSAALIWLLPAHAPPASAEAVIALLTPDGCAPPCWAGIRVGATTREEALTLLAANPWIGQVFSSEQQISWRWSGAQPALIDGERDGLIGLGGGVVQRIRLQTRIRFGDLWALYGAPDDTLMVRLISSRSSAFQIARYNAISAHAISTFRCPADPAAFWNATVTIGIGDIWTTEALNSVRFNIYHEAGWWSPLRSCRGRTGQ